MTDHRNEEASKDPETELESSDSPAEPESSETNQHTESTSASQEMAGNPDASDREIDASDAAEPGYFSGQPGIRC